MIYVRSRRLMKAVDLDVCKLQKTRLQSLVDLDHFKTRCRGYVVETDDFADLGITIPRGVLPEYDISKVCEQAFYSMLAAIKRQRRRPVHLPT